jgi:hypothetical protein
MFSVQEFVLKFERYDDVELFEIYSNWNNYSEEAREAFNIVVAKNGGVDNLLARMAERQKLLDEANKIRKAAVDFSMSGSDSTFVKRVISSEHLSSDKVDEIIDATFYAIEQEREDVRIKPRTIYGSILGCVVAGIVSGILWGALLIYSDRILGLLLIAPALICYWIIRAFTKQSKNNIVVLIATIVAICIGFLFGQILLGMVGRQRVSG